MLTSLTRSTKLDTALQLCLTTAEYRGKVTSLNLLGTLFLMQLSYNCPSLLQAHLWLTFNLVSNRTPMTFSAELPSSQLACSLYLTILSPHPPT